MPEASAGSGLIQMFKVMGIIPDPDTIRRYAKKLRRSNKPPDEIARQLANGATWRMTGAGVVASLPGAIPALGTMVQVGFEAATISAETWLMLRNLTALQMTTAALYGHDPAEDHRLDEMIIVWGLTTGTIVPVKGATTRVGTKIAVSQFNRRVSGKVLANINRKLGTTVFTKWGTKRGGIALGRLIPFGVGALVGGGMNYTTARGFAYWILKFYAEILPGDQELGIG